MDNEEQKTEKSTGSSRLGREAKIGVTVILVLVIVLVAVVIVRLRRSTADQPVAALEDRENEKEKARRDKKDETPDRYAKRESFGGKEATTIIPARSAAERPSKGANESDIWKAAADRVEAKRSGDGPIPPPPPVVDPLASHQSEHHEHDRYGHEGLAGREGDGGGPLRDAGSNVSLVPPNPELRAGAAEMGIARAEPRGLSAAESSPEPIRGRGEPSRYGDPLTPEPPPAGFSVAAGPSPIAGTESRAIGAAYNEGGLAHHGHNSSFSNPPAPRADGRYEVQPNDNYWAISERLYGSGAYFKALAELNRGKGAGEDVLRPGELISAPAVAQLERSYPALCPKPNHREGQLQQSQSRALTVSSGQQFRNGRTYTVAEGDTLFNIARYELGKASRWVEIYEMNRQVLGKDFNYLTPGIQLVLPESEKPDTLTRRPGGTYTR